MKCTAEVLVSVERSRSFVGDRPDLIEIRYLHPDQVPYTQQFFEMHGSHIRVGGVN